jgi:hypothetical protein
METLKLTIMKLMTFAEINDLENGQQISSLQGTVKKVFDQKTDVGQYGQWWLQNIILQDEHANELTVTWCCEDAFDTGCVGQQLYFEAGRDKKDQLAGIKREIKKKKDKDGNIKTYESVKVDDRAKVKILDGGPTKTAIPKSEQESDAERMFPSKPDPDWSEAHATAPELPLTTVGGNGGVMEARQHLMKACNLYVLCVKCVDKMIAPEMPNIAQTSEQFQAAVGTLFIEASRAGYVQKMPEKPIQ